MKTRWVNQFLRVAVVFLFFGLALLAPRNVQAASTRYYVKGNGGNDANSGLSWGQAFQTLQKALSVAVAGDEIWVSMGVYYPDNGGSYPLNSRDATFVLKNGVRVYGGFFGTETLLSQRDHFNFVTILSGDVDNNDINADNDFIAESTSDIVGANAYHVVTTTGNDSTAVLDGFYITAGQANGASDPYNKGGGVYLYESSPTFRNLIIIGNYAGMGGGMAVYSNSLSVITQPSLTNVEFSDNFALNAGGGMANTNSTPTLTNCVFSDNLAGVDGGGMDNSNSSPVLNHVEFWYNQAPYGGGMANRASSQAELHEFSFYGNIASSQGGGMWNSSSSPIISNGSFTNNTSVSGGGMYNTTQSDPAISYTDFIGNQADIGAGMTNEDSEPFIAYSLFDANVASYLGGGIHNLSGGEPYIVYTTFKNNQASTGGGMSNYNSNPTLRNVDFQNNQATSNTFGGGGMYNNSSSPTVAKVNFTGNIATTSGGGMYNYNASNPQLTDVNFSGNTAYNGGGMRNHYNNNQPQLLRVTFVGNEAAFGGGMSNDSSNPTLYNVTFSGNQANQGGGMNNYQSSPQLWNVTIYGNIAHNNNQGGGMYNSSSSLPFLRNVIIAGSFNGDCVNGTGGNIAGWYSLIQDTGSYACGAINGNLGFIVGQNPRLQPLANNGGFTLTHAPTPGSPVIDWVADNNCATSTDQRNYNRFIDGDRNGWDICDIGAVEFGYPVFLPIIIR